MDKGVGVHDAARGVLLGITATAPFLTAFSLPNRESALRVLRVVSSP